MAQVTPMPANIVTADTALIKAATDSIDSIATEPCTALIMERTDQPVEPPLRSNSAAANSWLIGGLTLIFCVVCLRYRSNSRYFRAIVRDLTDTRERHNLFDDTVRETSFLMLLNLLNTCSMGVILYEALCRFSPDFSTAATSKGIWITLGIMFAYNIFLTAIYFITGSVFTDYPKARIWTKGFFASNALMTFGLFPASLIGLFYPSATDGVLIFSAVIFAAAKATFIFKGMRIFMKGNISWLLFVYYLTGVEAVPLILATAGALALTAI